MKLNNKIAIILYALILAGMITGCSEPTGSYWDAPLGIETPTGSQTTAAPTQAPAATGDMGQDGHLQGIDYDAAFAAFAPDTAMILVSGFTVTWAELFFHMRGNINNLIQMYGDLPEWSELMYNGMTCAEAVIKYSVDNTLMYKAVEYGAGLVGAVLSAEDLETLIDSFNDAAAQYSGEEEFLRLLWEEDGLYGRDLYDYLVGVSYLASTLYSEMFGEYGELMSDEDAEEVTASEGYLMAKHILRLKTEDGDETPLRVAEDLIVQLDSYDGDDFEAFFDILMHNYSEDDDGLIAFPNGYLFQYGDMVPEFYDACIALEIGQHSGIVETTYGYHILLRVPINFDEIPSYNYRQYDFRTLRHLAALSQFDNALFAWVDSFEPEFTAEFDSIDVAAIFVHSGQ